MNSTRKYTLACLTIVAFGAVVKRLVSIPTLPHLQRVATLTSMEIRFQAKATPLTTTTERRDFRNPKTGRSSRSPKKLSVTPPKRRISVARTTNLVFMMSNNLEFAVSPNRDLANP
jgi:hypothetical protein